MAKAFNKLSHTLLLHKIFNIGIQGDVMKWIKSYLITYLIEIKALKLRSICQNPKR